MPNLSEPESRYIEGYAAALQDILLLLTGENSCAKSYDPMKVSDDGSTMHSYAFNMKNGGRSHLVADYESFEEIKTILAKEVLVDIALEIDVTIKTLEAYQRD